MPKDREVQREVETNFSGEEVPGDTKPTTIPDGAISDDCEVNSWEESLTEEENS